MENVYFGAVTAIAVGIFVTVAPIGSRADERCHQLEALRTQYTGVQLTADQKALKVKLVAWYTSNCGKHEVADVKSANLSNAVR